MQIEDKCIILDLRKLGESSLIISCLTQEHGLIKGVYKQRKSKLGSQVVPGNIMKVVWKARLEEHLGTLALENEQSITASLSFERKKLSILNSAISMCNLLLHEKEPQPEIYLIMHDLLVSLAENTPDIELLEKYVWLEIELLNRSGFGMDLSQCVATGSTENLAFVSPKSACAVSEESGLPYQSKLLRLPQFLVANSEFGVADIVSALDLTHYFFNKHILSPFGKKTPIARQQMLANI